MSQIIWELELGEYDRNMEAEQPEMEPVQQWPSKETEGRVAISEFGEVNR